MLSQLLHKLTPAVVIGTSVVIAAAAVGYVFLTTASKPASHYATATTGPIVEEVDSPGTVKAAQSLDLSFQVAGNIANAGPAVGTHVAAGQVLASLSSASQQAALEQAKAALQVQEANLSSVQTGTRPEDITVAQTVVNGAQATLSQAKNSLLASAQNAYVEADNAIHNDVDLFFNNPRSANPTVAFGVSDSQTEISMETQRVVMEQLLQQWQSYVNALPSDANSIDASAVAAQTRTNLQAVSNYLALVATGLTEAVASPQYPTATIQGYQSTIQGARTSISGAISSIDAAETAEKSAEAAYNNAQSQLALKKAGSTPQQIAAQQAQVAVAQANVDAAAAALAKTVITAPISGTITVNNAKMGQTASPNAPLISMISDTAFQFETYVSQADLGKLKVGDTATITLDAYQSGTALPAHVITIDPAATIQGGVSSYKITLQFDTNDPRIRAGLTGNVKIVTQSIADTLTVPSSAIITQGTDHFVLLKGQHGDVQTPVTVGVSSASGTTQILSGLSAGAQVQTFGTQ